MADTESPKILILRFGALGDIVHTTVIAQAIKKAYPNSIIHYCVENRYAEVIKNNPDIDKIYCYNHTQRKNWLYTTKFALELKKEHYDVIFNLTNALRNNLISYIAAPARIVNHVKHPYCHVVDDFYRTAKSVYCELKKPESLKLGVDEKVLNEFREKLSQYPHPHLVIFPGGDTNNNRQGRMWAKERWIEFGNLFNQLYGGTIFICGSPSEKDYHKTFASKIDSAKLCTGQYSLSEIMCLIKLADLFISGDTGPLHIASGLGTKTIGLFGSTNPQNVAPYGLKGYAVSAKGNCKFCWKKKCDKIKNVNQIPPCMNSIYPEDIIQVLNRL